MTPLSATIQAYAKHADDQTLTHLGHLMARMYTQSGYPPDMFLTNIREYQHLTLDKLQTIYMVFVFQSDIMEHRHASSAGDASLERLRNKHCDDMYRLVTTGELGVY